MKRVLSVALALVVCLTLLPMLLPSVAAAADISMTPGQIKVLTGSCPYENDSIHKVTASYNWSSSEPGVCSASGSGQSCTITAVRAGSARITCSCTYTMYLYHAVTRKWEFWDSGTVYDTWNISVGEPRTITFNANGGSVSITNKSAVEGSPYGTMPTPTKTGYSFLGWYTSISGGEKITTSSVVSGNITLYAHWQPCSYTIRFDANGGSGAMDSLSCKYTSSVKLPSNEFKWENRVFYCWNTKPDGSGTSYQSGEAVSGLASKDGATVTLYAIWCAKNHNVAYCSLSLDALEYLYTGEKISPSVVLKDGLTILKENQDYTISYSNNQAFGAASVEVRGTGSYQGKNKMYFYIIADCGAEPDSVFCRLDENGLLTIYGEGAMNDYDLVDYQSPWKDKTWAINSARIEEGVTNIGASTFKFCDSMYGISIAGSVKSIGKWAFYSCKKLLYIDIPDSVAEIEYGAFTECKMLGAVQLPEGLERLNDCFDRSSVKILFLPASVTDISEYVFNSWSALKEIWYGGTLEEWNALEFDFGHKLVSESPKLDGVKVYCDCDGLSLSSWELHGDTLFVGGMVAQRGPWYTDKSKIRNVVILQGVRYVASGAFNGCYQIENITLPDGLEGIWESAFESTGIRSLELPGSVSNIGTNAFASSKLESLTVMEGVTNLGYLTFCNCRLLKDVSLPSSLKAIGGGVFESCIGLTDVYYSGSEAQWEAISVDSSNTPLASATIHYNSSGPEESAEINSLTRTSTSVSATIRIAEGVTGAKVICAAYDESGRMLSFACKNAATGQNTYTFTHAEADHVTVFVIKDNIPLCRSKTA